MSRTLQTREGVNRGWFRPGPDPRRHQLTREENSRGGNTSWKRVMWEWREELGLPLWDHYKREYERLREETRERRRLRRKERRP